MKLLELLSPEQIVVPVQGETLRQALSGMVEALTEAGAITDAARFEELVADTLPRDVVTVGEAFLIYFRTDAVPRLMVALGVAPDSMHREHDPSKQARIVLLISAPAKETSRFLRTVSAFSHALGREEIVAGLLAAQEPQDVLAIEPLAEIELRDYLTVKDVMVRRQISVRPDTGLGDASQKMVVHNVPSLVVVSDTNEVLGMVTHRELLQHLLPLRVKRLTGGSPGPDTTERLGDPFAMPVREVMDRSVLCVSEDQTVVEVANMMLNRKIDRVPVVHDGAFIGFLTQGDIVRRLFGR